jgi:hypothetical protein
MNILGPANFRAMASADMAEAQGKVAQLALVAGEPQGMRVRKLLKLWLRSPHSNLPVDLNQKDLTEPSWQICRRQPRTHFDFSVTANIIGRALSALGNPCGNTVQRPSQSGRLLDIELLPALERS